MVPLAQAEDPSVFGAKATRLGLALRNNLPVPMGLALSPEFATSFSDGHMQQPMHTAAAVLGYPLAVRSSAIGEDGVSRSFAGQHLSVINVVSSEDLQPAVARVCESATNSDGYRRSFGITGPLKMGVVVQRQVDMVCAGVMFTRDPVGGGESLIVEGAWGQGEVVVQGLITPDFLRMNRSGETILHTPGLKDLRIDLNPDGGTRMMDQSGEIVTASCFTPERQVALADLANRCEAVFGPSLDIEWGFDYFGNVRLLQVRSSI